MYAFKKSLLITSIVLTSICFLIVLPIVFTGIPDGYGNVLFTAFIVTWYVFLAFCCSLILDKPGVSGFGIAGIIVVLLSLCIAVFLTWERSNLSAFAEFGMRGLSGYLELFRVLYLASFFSVGFAQGCILLRINPRARLVDGLRIGVLSAIGLLMLLSLFLMYELSKTIIVICYLLSVINIFGTIMVLLIHEHNRLVYDVPFTDNIALEYDYFREDDQDNIL